MLLAARFVQGVAAAMLLPNSLALLGSAYAGEARGKAIGSWAAATTITAAIGPLIGGWLTGVTGANETERYPYRPSRILESVADLVDEVSATPAAP